LSPWPNDFLASVPCVNYAATLSFFNLKIAFPNRKGAAASFCNATEEKGKSFVGKTRDPRMEIFAICPYYSGQCEDGFKGEFMKRESCTILIVEDDLNDQALIKAGFRAIGVEDKVLMASDGLEAIAYMKGEGKFSDRKEYPYPTIIMTDLKMPEGDGFAVLEYLKSTPDFAIIPTTVFSSSEDLDDIKRSYSLGASSYHLKPQTPEKLRTQLKILYDYWRTAEVPQIDISGKQLPTQSAGKLGERFPPMD
jgi:CheY-like chemotaxis protein